MDVWDEFYRDTMDVWNRTCAFLGVAFGPYSPLSWGLGLWVLSKIGERIYTDYIAVAPPKVRELSRKELERYFMSCAETNTFVGERNAELNRFIMEVCKMVPPLYKPKKPRS